jgi:hypothetical protein
VPEQVTRQRATASTDGYGDPALSWATPDTATFDVRGVEPVSSTEDNDGRQAVITGYRLYLAAGADVLPGDRVVLRGATYDVEGLPAAWASPGGSSVGGLVVALKGVSG